MTGTTPLRQKVHTSSKTVVPKTKESRKFCRVRLRNACAWSIFAVMPPIIRIGTASENPFDPKLTQKRREASIIVLTGTAPLSPPPLSDREAAVLQLIGDDQSTKQIAATLGVSIKTVETHRRSIATKLDRSGIAALTHYAIVHGLVELRG
jgi:DNA-binding CsgD family transcriptional regulator